MESQRERSATPSEVGQEADESRSPSPQRFGEQKEGGPVTGGEIQAHIQHVRAAIEAAKAANRPDIVRTEVIPTHDHLLRYPFTSLCTRIVRQT